MSSSRGFSRRLRLVGLSLLLLVSFAARLPQSPSPSFSSFSSFFTHVVSLPSASLPFAFLPLSAPCLSSGFWGLRGTEASKPPFPLAIEAGETGKRYQRQIQVASFLTDEDFRRLFQLTQAFEASTLPSELSAFVALRFFSPSFVPPAFASSPTMPRPLVNVLCQRVQSLLVSVVSAASPLSPLASPPLASRASPSPLPGEAAPLLTVAHLLQARRLMKCDFKIPRGVSARLADALVAPAPSGKSKEEREAQMRSWVAALLSIAEVEEADETEEHPEASQEIPVSSFLKTKMKNVQYLDLAQALLSSLERLRKETAQNKRPSVSDAWGKESREEALRHLRASAVLAVSRSFLPLLRSPATTRNSTFLQSVKRGLALLESELSAVVHLEGEETERSAKEIDSEDRTAEERDALRLGLLMQAYFNSDSLSLEDSFVGGPSLGRGSVLGSFAAIVETPEVASTAVAGFFQTLAGLGEAGLEAVLRFLKTVPLEEAEHATALLPLLNSVETAAHAGSFGVVQEKLRALQICDVWGRAMPPDALVHVALSLRATLDGEEDGDEEATPSDSLWPIVDIEATVVPVARDETETETEAETLFRTGTKQVHAKDTLLAKTHELRFTVQLATDWQTTGPRGSSTAARLEQVSLLLTLISADESAAESSSQVYSRLLSRQVVLPLVNAKKQKYQLQLSLDRQRLFPQVTGVYRFELLVADQTMKTPLRLNLFDQKLVFSRPLKLLQIPTGDGDRETKTILPFEQGIFPAPLLSWDHSPPPKQASFQAALVGAILCCLLPSLALWALWSLSAVDVPRKIGEPSTVQALFIGAIVVQGMIVALYFFCLAFLQLLPILAVWIAITSLIGYRALCQGRAQQLNECISLKKQT
ncbi:conserved hypothetical protein [Neospora caninum Liverpool]|uniref:Dolichyl-diphosphooligosaccharide--protein glycosyltransferase subunit 2 n=1 Tax=Neospora caninum (strain Liverpool) TaxID=572307 RepID=F0VAM9_NEOCL|nr:conserved hypothetical protein [Neospora caninum Liverpool]CBZ50784.1 conserved hypothetical protein [Neospora caninum Liverpool]|eukprot:XP_003880817.1 conserved hypothetical protein [Neospora caninum Liverpool]